MSKLGSLYIKLGEPEGELSGCTCEISDWAADEIERLRAELAALREQEPIATKLETQQFNCFHVSLEDSQRLAALPVGATLYAQPTPPSVDAHELWAAAQLFPGEGIEDGVDRITTLLAAAPKPEDAA